MYKFPLVFHSGSYKGDKLGILTNSICYFVITLTFKSLEVGAIEGLLNIADNLLLL